MAQALLERANKLVYAIDLVSPAYALRETAANLVNHTPNRPPSPLANSELNAIVLAVVKRRSNSVTWPDSTVQQIT